MDLLDAAPSSLETYRAQGGRGEFRLRSHFQPIFSLAHRRPVGYEGLVRVTREGGENVAPLDLLRGTPHGEARTALDRRCRSLHVRNFQRLGATHSWLFLNVDPYVAAEGRKFGAFFAQMLESSGFPAHRVAIELVETPHEDEESLCAAIEYYRELGCLIVIDDFGAGSSNFDRIWRLKPDIVKIDREMTRRVTSTLSRGGCSWASSRCCTRRGRSSASRASRPKPKRCARRGRRGPGTGLLFRAAERRPAARARLPRLVRATERGFSRGEREIPRPARRAARALLRRVVGLGARYP